MAFPQALVYTIIQCVEQYHAHVLDIISTMVEIVEQNIQFIHSLEHNIYEIPVYWNGKN